MVRLKTEWVFTSRSNPEGSLSDREAGEAGPFVGSLQFVHPLPLTFPSTLSGIPMALSKYMLNKRRQEKQMTPDGYQSVIQPPSRYSAVVKG